MALHFEFGSLGWIKDKPDSRDYQLTLDNQPIQTVYLAHKYNYTNVYDQGQLGSCTANALAFLVQFDLLNKHDDVPKGAFTPSRLFIYYYERAIEGTVNQDSGAEIRDGIKVIANYGAPSEDLWPYDISQFAVAPPQKAVTEGLNFKGLIYRNVFQDTGSLVNALLLGYPIAFGFTVYDSFMTQAVASSGIVPMPDITTENVLGGHAVVIVGYDTRWDTFIVRNSWGRGWGQNGYFRMPAAYINNPDLCNDFWTINLIN